ncbi:ABC transporter ATP-binding protein [Rhodovulum steppense]|uniref:Carbohydrate ABC transporter ATP-binding protein (CUT1 family) n=1 Tax=Rhodovulum steppense TaxID=540251 RepID=A0A4R1Z1N3_9RHOB|nr:sn-glycerol-3-phosphate ABC transporter ATP-binding protein UgpC [Rhodovulum steppense]TCM87530.1 carbohydrate ABC transporter ATP-binding protein (CUT1 family) [Rhodovulum steppense]
MASGIRLENLRKSFGGTEVIKGVDLEIEPGEFVVLVGPSGCGKSTLLNLIAGLETVSSGDILIGGQNVNRVPPRDRDIAMVFQSYALYPTRTVRANITFGMETRRVPKDAQEAALEEFSRLLQIDHLLDRKPGQLSGGQRQRVAMGRALVRQPAVFLFDEPLSNLDAKLRIEMRTEIKKLHQRLGKTVVYVTHDQIEAMTLATRIAVMDNGHIRQFADPATIYESPVDLFVAGFMGSPPMNMIPGRLFHENGQVFVLPRGARERIRFPLDGPAGQGEGLTDGREVVLGLRPETIFAAGAKLPGPNRYLFEAPVEVVEPTGPDTMLVFQIGDQDMVARVRPEDVATPGAAFRFEVDMGKAKLFDAGTGKAL